MGSQSEKGSLLFKQMPATRRRIMTLVKEKGALTADELAEHLGISSVAVRRHLTRLESDGLLMYEEIQRGMGRPSFVYKLGEASASYFPRRYEELATAVLETIRGLYGVEAIDAIFRMRTEHVLNTYRQRVNGSTLDKRLEQLTQLRDADGYMSTWELRDDGTFILREANCPIIHVAEGCESACSYDHALLVDLLDAEVIRKGHIVRGDGACMYEVKPRPQAVATE